MEENDEYLLSSLHDDLFLNNDKDDCIVTVL